MSFLLPELEKFDLELKYLVIDSKYGTHPWRFSVETFLKLYKNKVDVYYLSLITIDPSVILGKSKLFLRKKIHQNERNNYVKSMINKHRIISIKLFLPKIKNIVNCFKVFLGLYSNKRLQIAIDSWLSTKYGSTRYKETLLTRFHSMRVANSYFKTLDLLSQVYSKDNYDVIITFNGRFPVDSAIIEYCEINKIKTILFDGGSIAHNNFNRIQYFETSPHNGEEIRQKIDRYWGIGGENKISEAKLAMASLISGERFIGNSFNWENIVDSSNFKKTDFYNLKLGRTVTFFASSDWEQGAIKAWSSKTGFINQFDMLIFLAKACDDLKFKLLIKPHPIKKNVKKNSDLNELYSWQKFCELNNIEANFIFKSDGLSTKFLLTESAVIAGYGTSVLAQAIYLGRPTIVGRKEPWINGENIKSLVENEEQIRMTLTEITQDIFKYEQNSIFRHSVLPWVYYRTVCGLDMVETNFSNKELFVGATQLDQKKRIFTYFLR